jgi:hypothetical protein
VKTTYRDLRVCRLDREAHLRTCGYWYLVYSNSTNHTAFETRQGLDRWARERGLILAGTLDEVPSYCAITGEYRTEAHMEADALEGLAGELSRTLSNGDYVDAVITADADGVRTVHTLNPNVRERRVHDYRESRQMMS